MKNLINRISIINAAIIIVFFIVSTGFAIKNKVDDETQKRKIQIALLLDTSNSMDGLIDQAKSQLWNIVNELAKAKHDDGDPILEIALYEYGNSNLSINDDYIRQVQPLITDLDKISIMLFELRTNGGQEYCGSVIQKATQQLEWSKNDKDIRMIFIAGNEPFNQGKISYEAACGNARSKGIIINAIHCGTFSEGVNGLWKSGALIGGGDFMSIEQDRKTVYISTPYDVRINELSIQFNNTYIFYGKTGTLKKEEQMKADQQAASVSESNLTARNSVKASKYYKNSTWDLVDASETAGFDITKIDKKTLPVDLQKLTNEQLVAYIKKKTEERNSLKNQIQVLNTAREYYIAQNKKDQVESVETSMVKAVKTQALKKNYKW
jgi:hypothetical protein